MNKHTPAPWSVYNNIGRKSEIGVVAAAAPCVIAIMGNQKEWPQEARANAALIAAAPELLAALKTLANDFEAIINGDDMSGMSDTELFDAFLETARAAITKAEA